VVDPRSARLARLAGAIACSRSSELAEGYPTGSTLRPRNSQYPNWSAGAVNTLQAAGMFNMSDAYPLCRTKLTTGSSSSSWITREIPEV
jgi:hypothetical protein